MYEGLINHCPVCMLPVNSPGGGGGFCPLCGWDYNTDPCMTSSLSVVTERQLDIRRQRLQLCRSNWQKITRGQPPFLTSVRDGFLKVETVELEWHGRLDDARPPEFVYLCQSGISGDQSVRDIHAWHRRRGWAGFAYHFLVSKKGVVYEGRPLGKAGAYHADYNRRSLGICVTGDYSRETMPEAQIQALARLCACLKDFFPGIQAFAVGPEEPGGTASSCPPDRDPFPRIMIECDTLRKTGGYNII